MSLLGERLLAVDAALEGARFPHAFGGGRSRSHTARKNHEARAISTSMSSLGSIVSMTSSTSCREASRCASDRAKAKRDGQVRVWWEETPVDLFFDVHDFHREISKETVRVPFEGPTIRVLGCEALVVFKAMFNRTKDWADIEAVLDAGAVDGPRVLQRLRSLLGRSDPAVVRLSALVEG